MLSKGRVPKIDFLCKIYTEYLREIYARYARYILAGPAVGGPSGSVSLSPGFSFVVSGHQIAVSQPRPRDRAV
jgi:hypothetical protein